ncbi:SDR family oxidoreductase [Saccharophagus degradans]|uniref:Short-chain dehydrogenase/reductase SDR n=2 Tax=Saccharophagus degradans TaxID=86304 RepID=Q21I42_SACD2|nr:SDR family oxidoreductase [Saccharophagus degradans]ABD81637.1 short-chain dehydrogenase/reductase SDR [Saccharophagus degradans 2-40]MBU2986486.1 SDR family oxidoreductase [Saccharophagus degradans]MDO6424560.1 SDR family oxidoreductase [Saccharophagus degradans]MDO6608817.1 SDR family oxidoreductase [Saccharophagus degradans]WGP00149.1 SDR family oxidoreductase [Saccharophagus degradans]
MSQVFDFSGRTVVVVGGTSGINRGVAECFARAGAKVAVASRSQEKVDETVAALQQAGAEQAMGFAADVRDVDAIAAGLQGIATVMGSIDVLVSGAAGNFPALAEDLSANGFKSVIDIDLLGTFHVMKAAFPHLTKPGASIVNISAPQAFLPMQAQTHVCAAKAGVDMVTRCLALEWGEHGIRVNSLVPGPIEGTEGMKRLAPTPELMELAKQSVPLQRLGKPEDIGNMCMYLASEQAAYVSGAIIPVDGGWSLAGASGLSQTLVQMLKQLKNM